MKAIKFSSAELGKTFTFIKEIRDKVNTMLENFVDKVDGDSGSPSDTPTINGEIGTVYGSNAAIAAGAIRAITVTNNKCKSTSVVFAQVVGHGGAGEPVVRQVTAIADGSFVVEVFNMDDAAATNGVINVQYLIL